MGETQHHAGARRLELGHLGVGEEEVDELHRGRLAVGGGAVDVGLRLADDALALDLQEGRLLDAAQLRERSEEHTSELQSLMRISYAVFCLNITTTCQPSLAQPIAERRTLRIPTQY